MAAPWTHIRTLILGVALASSSASRGQGPVFRHPTSERAQPATTERERPADALPTDAEKIARLQRSVEETSRQIEEMRASLDDPGNEYRQAESAFSEIDRQIGELRASLADAGDAESDAKQKLEVALAELEPKHRLAKERFDLAIRERKMLQQQIITLQQKLQQDTDALSKLKGELSVTSQPTVAVPAPAIPAPQVDATPAPVSPGAPALTSPDAVQGPGAAAPRPVSPELSEAREEAVRKQSEAQTAQAEVATVTERINSLRKSIELERKLLETSRQKAENAQQAERTLNEALQKRLQEGSTAAELRALQQQIVEGRARLREAENEIRDRTDNLTKYQADVTALQAEHIAAMEQSLRMKAEAERAEKRVERLESPLAPHNLWGWFLQRGPKALGIVLVMAAVLWLLRLAEGRLAALLARHGGPRAPEVRENRARTLVGVFHSAVTVATYGGGGLMLLTEMGVNVVPLMGGAAVLGLAVAFGAQNLIRDYFYGFMILLENQYTINDVVKIGDVAGQVERITLRVTVLRGLDGTVHFVPNGEITRVSNMTHEWSRALFDIPVAYKENVDRVMNELMELGKELRRDPDYRGLILEMPEMLGVDEFANSAVVIKFLIKTRPLKQWTVKRELLRRIKKRFDELGIEIPYPHRTIYHRQEGPGPPRELENDGRQPQEAP